jgi:hypothetical protein
LSKESIAKSGTAVLEYRAAKLKYLGETMATYQSQIRSKARKEKIREAISLAMEGLWQKAAETNRELLELFPGDIETLNRLGKAYTEVGDYTAARNAFAQVIELNRSNPIAKRNLARLEVLEKTDAKPRETVKPITFRFLAESGKAIITLLSEVASPEVVVMTTPGESVTLVPIKNKIEARNENSEYLGRLDPRLSARLTRLMKGGNRYEATVTNTSEGSIVIIVREVYRSTDQQEIASFPTQNALTYHPVLESNLAQYGLPEEAEVKDQGRIPYLDWNENDDDTLPPVERVSVSNLERNLDEYNEIRGAPSDF